MSAASSTFGPAYDEQIDGRRVRTQMNRIRDFMIGHPGYHSLPEISAATGDPPASVSAQLRHLRKPRFGSYTVNKRRRSAVSGLWEYEVTR